MVHYLVRRRKLGRGSCRGIVEHSQQGIQVKRHWRDQLPEPQGGYIFRWGCTALVPTGGKVVNSVEAIQFVNDKATSRIAFAELGLAPESSISWVSFPFYGNDGDIESHPAILRPRRHAQGKHLFLVTHRQQAKNIIELHPSGIFSEGYYISKFIPKVAEYRVFIVSGRVVWVAKKTPATPGAIAWNVSQGASFQNVNWMDWPIKALKNAIACFNLTALDFGGVDVMVDGDGKAYCLEINSAPSQTSPYRMECTAKAFDYIITHGRERIPVSEQIGKYRKYIHPAIDPSALL